MTFKPRHISKPYMSRSAAIRAARDACKSALGSAIYEAAEGPDYIIHPSSVWPHNDLQTKRGKLDFGDRWKYEIVGPAANKETKEE